VVAACRRLASRGARRGGGAAEGSADGGGGGTRPRPRWGLVMGSGGGWVGAARVLARGVESYRRRHPRRRWRRLIGGEGSGMAWRAAVDLGKGRGGCLRKAAKAMRGRGLVW
jgi:hypothetical protein